VIKFLLPEIIEILIYTWTGPGWDKIAAALYYILGFNRFSQSLKIFFGVHLKHSSFWSLDGVKPMQHELMLTVHVCSLYGYTCSSSASSTFSQNSFLLFCIVYQSITCSWNDNPPDVYCTPFWQIMATILTELKTFSYDSEIN